MYGGKGYASWPSASGAKTEAVSTNAVSIQHLKRHANSRYFWLCVYFYHEDQGAVSFCFLSNDQRSTCGIHKPNLGFPP